MTTKAYSKEYRQTHKEQISIYQKSYMKKYRETHKEYFKLWWKSNVGKDSDKRRRATLRYKAIKRVSGNNRRLKLKGLTIEIVQQVYEDNIKRYGTLTCYLCLKAIEFGKDHLEHKMPLSKGGTNFKENLDVACEGCNLKKGVMTVEEFKGKFPQKGGSCE
jgi:5-methylcytosine-specific restriction endonuclease McrA